MSPYRDQDSGDGCQVLVYEMYGLLPSSLSAMMENASKIP